MTKRSLTAKQREWLLSQLTDWQSQAMLTPDQASRILNFYESSNQQSEREQSTSLLVLMGIAALLVGLGALLLIGYNWDAMPAALKLLIIFGVIIGTHATACVLRFKRGALMLSEVTFFLGCLFYGAGIFLVAQIFHLNAHYPAGVWWWSVGVLPFALCLQTPLLHVLLVSLLGIWCGMEIIGFGDIGLWFFGRWGFVPNGAYSLPILALPGLIWAYRRKSISTVSLYVPLLAWWVILQPIAWELREETVYFIGAVGGLLLVVGEYHQSGSRFAIPYRAVGVLLSAGILLALSFHQFTEAILGSDFEPRSLLFVAVAVITSTAIVYWDALQKRRHSPDSQTVMQQILRRQWLPLGLVLLLAIMLFWHMLVGEPVIPTILANAAMVFMAVWLMNVGIREDRGRPFAAGVMYFLLWTIIRYIDLFGNFGGMPGAAMMFFVCGGALFGLAQYWRKRGRPEHG